MLPLYVAPFLCLGELAFGQTSALCLSIPPPLSWLQTSRIDQSFPSTNLASLLAFEQQATNPAFGNNSSFFLLDQVKHMFRF